MCAVAPPATAMSAAASIELADIVRAHGDTYRQTHPLALVQQQTLRDLHVAQSAVTVHGAPIELLSFPSPPSPI